jgi:hypothetical protein
MIQSVSGDKIDMFFRNLRFVAAKITVKMEVTPTSGTSVNIYHSTRRHTPQSFIVAAVRTSNLTCITAFFKSPTLSRTLS